MRNSIRLNFLKNKKNKKNNFIYVVFLLDKFIFRVLAAEWQKKHITGNNKNLALKQLFSKISLILNKDINEETINNLTAVFQLHFF